MIKPFTGDDLQRFRKRIKLTQTEFAKEIGIADTTVSKYECMPNTDLPKTIRLAISAWWFGLPPFQVGDFGVKSE